MKPFIRKKLPLLMIAVQAVLILGLLFYIVPGRYRLYDIVLYDAAENVPQNPLMGYAPPAQNAEDCAQTDLVFILLPFSEWEPQEGVFDREGVTEKYHLEEYKAGKKHAVLRFVCDIPSIEAHMDIPEWLRAVSGGMEYDDASGKGYAPDYGNEIFLQAHKEALDALASWCREDNFVSFVEIGSVGQNGVWTSTADTASGIAPSEEVFGTYEKQYAEAFSQDEDIELLTCAETQTEAPEAGSWNDVLGDKQAVGEWTTRSRERALSDLQKAEAGEKAGNKVPKAADGEKGEELQSPEIWTKAPVGGGLTGSLPMNTLLMESLSDTLEQVRGSHVTFIGPNCPDAEQQAANGSEMIQRDMGYCLYLSRLQTTMDFIHDELQLHFTFNNIGAAPMYRDWPVKMFIYDDHKECIREQTLDLKLSEILPGREVTVTGTLPYSRKLLRGYSVGIAIVSPDGTETITLAQKGVIPNSEGVHRVYRFKKTW
jgi:hypothetical protein